MSQSLSAQLAIIRDGLLELSESLADNPASSDVATQVGTLLSTANDLIAQSEQTDVASHQKHVEAELYFQVQLLNAVQQAVIAVDLESKITFWNSHAEALYGWTAAEALGRDFLDMDIVRPVDGEQAVDILNRLKDGQSRSDEFEMCHRDGQGFPVVAYSAPVVDADGEVVGVLGIFADISRRKRTENTYRALVNHSVQALAILQDGRAVFANRAIEDLTGYTPEEYVALTAQELHRLVHPEDREWVWGLSRTQMIDKDAPDRYEWRLIRKDGSLCWVEMQATIIEYDGRPATHVALIDITGRKHSEQALRDSEQVKRSMLEAIPDLVLSLGSDGVYREVYGAENLLVLQSIDEYAGKKLEDILPAHVVELTRANILRTLESGEIQIYDYELDVQSGHMHLEGHMVPSGPDEVLVVVRNVTERKQAEDALQKRVNQLSLLNYIGQAASVLEMEVLLVQATNRIRYYFDYEHVGIFLPNQDRSALVMHARSGLYVDRFPNPHVLPAGKGMVNAALELGQTVMSNDVATEPRFVNPFYPEEIIGSELCAPMVAGDEVIGVLDLQSRHKDAFNETDVLVLETLSRQLGVAIQNAHLYEEVQGHAELLERYVAERTAELQAANRRLEELSRARDDFIATISHELRTPLTTIYLNHHLMEQYHPELKDRYLAPLSRSVQRLQNTVEELLYVSRMERAQIEFEPQQVDLNAVVEVYVNDQLPVARKRDLNLKLRLAKALSSLTADPNLVERVLGILLNNALNYTPAGGKVTVSTYKGKHKGVAGAGFRVKDTGYGISPEEQASIFQRFYRGKLINEKLTTTPGTGLGLAIALEIIDKHDGSITVESTGVEGEGATFTVWLPVQGPQE